MNKERLEKLATHLETGKLGHKKFDFGIWDSCAIGECPVIFPEDWFFNPVLKIPTLKNKMWIQESIREFFDIDDSEATLLFRPTYKKAKWNDFTLGDNASQFLVAQGIKNFIAYKERE